MTPVPVIIDAVRTPIGRGKPNGMFANSHPVDLEAAVLRALVERNEIDPAEINDVIGGCVSQIGEQSLNVTRQAVLAAGFPDHVPATTIDRQCGSSQQAMHFAAHGIAAGVYEIVVACGVESMSRVPMGSTVTADPWSDQLRVRYPDGMIPQGIAAERIAKQWDISRTEADALAVRSHTLAATATSCGYFDAEIVPVSTTSSDGGFQERTVDEGVRPDTSLERLNALGAAFRGPEWEQRFPDLDWIVTAGNSSQISDGAAAVLLASEARAKSLGLRPKARFRSFSVTGDDPLMVLSAPIPATQMVLKSAGMTLGDIDLVEINEAFTSVVLAWTRELKADPDRINVHGGAVALGHPLGASGSRLAATLLSALEQHDGTVGLQVMCEAGGLANAMILERI